MWLLRVLIYLVLAISGHAVLNRMPLSMNIVFKFLVAATPNGLLLIGNQWLRDGWSLETWAAVALYAFLCELYIFLFTFVGSSISVALLLTLAQGSLSFSEIDSLYSDDQLVRGRFEKLLKVGFIKPSESGYILTPKSKVLMQAFSLLQAFFRHSGTPISMK